MLRAETARASNELAGPFPLEGSFAGTNWVLGAAESEMPAYNTAFDAEDSVKRHTACDECRKRKLKCSGEPSGCERCLKQHLICHYSAQKQMGRPRKRQKIDHTSDDPSSTPTQTTGNKTQDASQSATPPPPIPPQQPVQEAKKQIDPELPESAIERTSFENVCNAPITQAIRRSNMHLRTQHASRSHSLQDSGSGPATRASSSTSPYDGPRTPPTDVNRGGLAVTSMSYPTDVSLWPDFSDMTILPMPVQDSHRKENNPSYLATDLSLRADGPSAALPDTEFDFDLDADPRALAQLPAIPECPCLPNLYLTLSTLSTLSSFPVSAGTIDTLLGAHRTGRGVVYCAVCPQKYQSGSQNVMLSSTLITVLADQWLRVKKATAADLRIGFGTGAGENEPSGLGQGLKATTPNTNAKYMSVKEGLEWRTFGYNLVRAYVFGDAPVPTPPGSSAPLATSGGSSQPPFTLCDLCNTLERRQKQWHDLLPPTDEFPIRLTEELARGDSAGMTLEELKRCENEALSNGDGHLCLRLVRHAKMVVRSLESDPPRVDI